MCVLGVEREDLTARIVKVGGRFFELSDCFFVGAESRAGNDGYMLGDGFEGDAPIDGGIATADDHDFLVPEILDSLREVVNAFAFELANAWEVDSLRLERADTGADDYRLAKALGHARPQLQDP